MFALSKGRYAARFAASGADLCAAQALRGRSFGARALDADRFDSLCRHVLIEEAGRLVCCFRILPLRDGSHIGESYSAQFYDLSALAGFPGRMAEVGRFCIDAGCRDPDILRVAWGALTRLVDDEGIEMLFGCSSFPGTDWERHSNAFALLAQGHLAPPGWAPGIKAPKVVPYARHLAGLPGDQKRALREMPPLLRSYLLMGGWVSDHAVVDADLGTLHVFTGLEVRAIPEARARALRLVAG
ncbi:GNAT family N-acetyltransferase [Paenirhodobacter sp.]|uniref:GNAT family N-acetyltransferase n=1 Tax=Paenirhodobacter sp. TaxID=1965326 RepID=UPI003B3EBCCB